ncbi:MAG: HEAT repeat domain-containing protein, partial [Spirochaetota bacterium]
WRAWGVGHLPAEQVRPHLATLATDPVWHVRDAVARHASTPPAVLAALATDPDSDVQKAVRTRRGHDHG